MKFDINSKVPGIKALAKEFQQYGYKLLKIVVTSEEKNFVRVSCVVRKDITPNKIQVIIGKIVAVKNGRLLFSYNLPDVANSSVDLAMVDPLAHDMISYIVETIRAFNPRAYNSKVNYWKLEFRMDSVIDDYVDHVSLVVSRPEPKAKTHHYIGANVQELKNPQDSISLNQITELATRVMTFQPK